jgi:hypothetical protein
LDIARRQRAVKIIGDGHPDQLFCHWTPERVRVDDATDRDAPRSGGAGAQRRKFVPPLAYCFYDRW